MDHPPAPPDGRARSETPGDDDRSDGSALSDLIALEQRIEGDLEAATAESERLLEAARVEARAIAEQDGGTLETELARLEASIDGDCESAIERLEAEARAEEQRFLAVDEATAVALARFVAERLVGDGEPA